MLNYVSAPSLDTTDFTIMQIPFLSFELGTYSAPKFSNFTSIRNNNFIIDISEYEDKISEYAHHLIDFQTNIFTYTHKKGKNLYSYGITHRFFGEFFLSKDLVSLLVNGNYNSLNTRIDLRDDYAIGYNYLSVFFGYSKLISKGIRLGTRLKLIKGINIIGVDNNNSSVLLTDDFSTPNNPFSIHVNSDFNFFTTTNSSVLNNLGCAIDLSFEKKISQYTIYTHLLELGFVSWMEDQSISKGELHFDGINYDSSQDLITEFNSLYDTIIDVFDFEERHDVKSLRLLPFYFNIGVNKQFYNSLNNVNVNYNVKKLYKGILHTGTISYTHSFPDYHLSFTPQYSFNRFHYINIGMVIHKSWGEILHTSMFIDNIIGTVSDNIRSSRFGFGINFYLLF
tara:strand:+ start:138 stop:1322 length:1185 start_codon:yes stop_codon:yes gene_type:complete